MKISDFKEIKIEDNINEIIKELKEKLDIVELKFSKEREKNKKTNEEFLKLCKENDNYENRNEDLICELMNKNLLLEHIKEKLKETNEKIEELKKINYNQYKELVLFKKIVEKLVDVK